MPKGVKGIKESIAERRNSESGKGISGMTAEQAKHKLYVQPLMKFFHDCIDFERTVEIDK